MNNRRLSIIAAAVLASGTLFGVVACQQYVNIPAQTGDVASADANGSQVRNLLGEALRGLRPETLTPGVYQIILPNGSTPQTYEDVVRIAGDRFTWSDAKGSGNVVDQLEIRSIRIRGLDASVDIIRSTQPGDPQAPRQLVTVYLKNYVIGGWGTQRVRVWRMSVADALEITSGHRPDDQNAAQPMPIEEIAPPTKAQDSDAVSDQPKVDQAVPAQKQVEDQPADDME